MILAAPFPIAFHFYHREVLPPRLSTPRADAAGIDLAGNGFPAGSGAAPIVLAYHDIAPNSSSKYSITPEAFEAQMSALDSAGYRTITADQFLRYIDGADVPPHSVLITFDDGTDGLWTYADKILERHRFTAVSFLITGLVGTNQPYYLTWQQIAAMQDSGRWDFGSHTRDLHHRISSTPTGEPGAALTRRKWLPAEGRAETQSEFLARIRTDLTGSIDDLTTHGLPRPELFAYPFSENEAGGDAEDGNGSSVDASTVVHALFRVSFVNNAPMLTTSRRQIRDGVVNRIELTDSDSPQSLLNRMRRTTTIPVTEDVDIADRARWIDETGQTADVTVDGRTVHLTATAATYARASFAPRKTADWTDYTISTTITGLDPDANPTDTIAVRTGSPEQILVRVSRSFVTVSRGEFSATEVLYESRLAASERHRVDVHVSDRSTDITIDGAPLYSHPVSGPPEAATGGFTFAGDRRSAADPFALFSGVAIRPDADS
ncbi:polysaccharide deacetylase family protein [Tomitella gaofuii]|uniref:polysaccharide deacetylase family protein n=1 Tax=Tomitella gaofuii TaxID=2760083 RepID=UPI0015F8D739|nr:polysaccharide deacetylase family protein [Tomitella gaofuii]